MNEWVGTSGNASDPRNWSEGIPESGDSCTISGPYRILWDLDVLDLNLNIEDFTGEFVLGSNCTWQGTVYAPEPVLRYSAKKAVDSYMESKYYPPDGYVIGDGVYDRDWVREHGVGGLSLALPVFGRVAKTWQAVGADNWSTAAAWFPALIPVAGDDVTFSNASVQNCTVDVPSNSLNSLTIANTYTGTITFTQSIFCAGNGSIGNQVTLTGANYLIMTATSNFAANSIIGCGLSINPGAGNSVTATTNAIVSGAYTCPSGTHNLNSNALSCSGASSVAGVLTPGATGTIGFGATATLVITGKIGADLGYGLVIDCNPSASSGELSCPNASGNFTFGATTWISPTTLTANSGHIHFDKAGTTTLGTALSTYGIVVDSGATLNSSAASNYAVTTTNQMTVAGTLTLNGSTVSCTGTGTANGYSVQTALGSTFAGGTSTCTFGCVRIYEGGTVTLSSGVTTINNGNVSNVAFLYGGSETFDDGNGTIALTRAGTQLLYSGNNITLTLYNLTLNNASCAVSYYPAAWTPLVVANLLTITAGSFTSWDGTTSANLTVTARSTIGGTLDCKAGTISLGSGLNGGAIAVVVTGTFTGGSGTHTYGSIYDNSSTGGVTLSSGTTTINGADSNGNSLAFGASAVFDDGNGTLTFTLAGAQKLYDVANVARTLYNVTVNNASCALTYYAAASFALTVANNLTITAGSFTTWDGTTSANLTVTNATSITGTLDCKASTINLASGSTTANGLAVNNGGAFIGGTGTHAFNIMILYAGSSFTATTGNTTLNGYNSSTVFYKVGTVTFNANGGTFILANPLGCIFEIYTAGISFYNLTINSASFSGTLYSTTAGLTCAVTNNFVMTSGTLILQYPGQQTWTLAVTGTSSITSTLTPSASTCTFNGAVTVNNGGTLGGNTAWTCDSNAAGGLTVSSGGTFLAPNGSGSFTFQAFVVNTGATFTTNSGTATCDIGGGGGGVVDGTLNPITFYNLTFNNAGSSYIFAANVTVNNVLTTATTCYFYTTGSTLIIGTASAAGSFVNNAAMWACLGALSVTVKAASASYPCVCTGTDWNWDRNAGTVWNLKWLDYQIDAVTGGGGVTVNWTGNMTIDGWTTSAGDTTSCTVAGAAITAAGYPKQITMGGNATFTGALGSNITIVGQFLFNCAGGAGSAQTYQYVTIQGDYGIYNDTSSTGSLTIHDCTARGTSYFGFYQVGLGTVVDIHDSSIICNAAVAWPTTAVGVYEGRRVQLSNCVVASVALQTTSGWLSSITHNGVANAHKICGVLNASSPAAGYQIADTDNVTLSNADAYSTPFNTVFTLDQNETCAALTSAASTTLTPATYTLTTNGAVGLSGTLGGATAWTHDCNGFLSINAGGVYTAARTLNYSATSIVIIGTFTNNTTTFACDGTGAQALSGTFSVTNLTNSNTVGSVTITGITVSGVVTSSDVKLELITSTIVTTTANCGSTGRIYVKDIQGVNGNFGIILADGGSQAYSDITAGVRADANDDVYIYLESGGTACTFSFDVAALNFGILYKQAAKTINITWGSYTAPGVPTSPAISTAVNAQLTFSWVTPASTGGWKIQGYDIWRSQTSGTETLHSEDGIVNTHVDTGLTARDVYYYQALSWNSVGDSNKTTEVTAMVNGPPNVPQSLAISLEFDRSLCITWATPADNGNFAISAYKVYSDIFTPPTTLEATLGVILYYQDIPITNRVLRYYKVTAVNSYGEGAASSIVSDTPECHSGLGFVGNLTQTITIKPRSGTNKNGQPAFGNSFTAYGRITHSNRNARDNKGEVVLSKVQILVDGSVDVDSYDSITLSDGRTMPIIEVREIYQVISGTAITVQKEIYT